MMFEGDEEFEPDRYDDDDEDDGADAGLLDFAALATNDDSERPTPATKRHARDVLSRTDSAASAATGDPDPEGDDDANPSPATAAAAAAAGGAVTAKARRFLKQLNLIDGDEEFEEQVVGFVNSILETGQSGTMRFTYYNSARMALKRRLEENAAQLSLIFEQVALEPIIEEFGPNWKQTYLPPDLQRMPIVY